MIESDLFAHLSSEVALVNSRVFPLKMPDGCEKPSLVYTVVSEVDRLTLDGGSYAFNMRIQIDCYSYSYSEVKQLKNDVKQALYSFGNTIDYFSSTDDYESDTELYRQIIDFNIKG